MMRISDIKVSSQELISRPDRAELACARGIRFGKVTTSAGDILLHVGSARGRIQFQIFNRRACDIVFSSRYNFNMS